jgi:hypothetical protein
LLWEIPKAELNQLIHAHLYTQGAICRPPGFADDLVARFDELVARIRAQREADIAA